MKFEENQNNKILRTFCISWKLFLNFQKFAGNNEKQSSNWVLNVMQGYSLEGDLRGFKSLDLVSAHSIEIVLVIYFWGKPPHPFLRAHCHKETRFQSFSKIMSRAYFSHGTWI